MTSGKRLYADWSGGLPKQAITNALKDAAALAKVSVIVPELIPHRPNL